MNLQVYGPGHIESFLLNYELLVKDLPEVAADWPDLPDEERSHHRAELLQAWGNRKVLGMLFKAQRLDPAQEALLAELDRRLLEQAALMEQCFGLDLGDFLKRTSLCPKVSGSSCGSWIFQVGPLGLVCNWESSWYNLSQKSP